MKKITFLLSLVFAFFWGGITASAQVASLDELSNNKCYTLTAERGYLSVSENSKALYGIQGTPDATNKNTNFVIYKAADGQYYFWNVGQMKFVSAMQTVNDPHESMVLLPYADSYYDIHRSNNDTYKWYLTSPNNGNQFMNMAGYKNCVVDSWNTQDAGNRFKIEEVGDFNGDIVAKALLVNNSQMVYLKCERGYMYSNAEHTELVTTGRNATPDGDDYKFVFYNAPDGKLYLWNVGAAKFVQKLSGTKVGFADTQNPVTFTPNTGDATYYFDLQLDGSKLNHNNDGGAGSIVTGWDRPDAGNKWTVEAVEGTFASVKCLGAYYLNQASAILQQENILGGYTSQDLADLKTAYEKAKADYSDANRDALISAFDGMSSKSKISLSNDKVFMLKNAHPTEKRGYLVLDDDAPGFPNLASVEYPNEAMKAGYKQVDDAKIHAYWAVYTSSKTGKKYLYNLTNGKFLKKNGSDIDFGEEALSVTLPVNSTASLSNSIYTEGAADALCMACGRSSYTKKSVIYSGKGADGGNPIYFILQPEQTIPADVLKVIEAEVLLAECGGFENFVGALSVENATKGRELMTGEGRNAANAETVLAYPLIDLKDGGYYRVINAVPGFNKKKGLVWNGTETVWNTVDKSDVNAIYQIVLDKDKYVFKSVNAKKYIQGVAGAMNPNMTDNGHVELIPLNAYAQYNLKFGNGVMHANGHGNGAGSNGNVISYPGSENSASAWCLAEATDIEVALNNAGAKSYATTYLPFSVSAAEGAELYTGELNGNVMNLTKSHTGVAAEQGIVLVGESSATKAVLTIGEGKATGSGLVGTLTPKDVEAKSVLTLGRSGSEVGFFAFTGTQIDANKAYVKKTAGASAVMINFGEVTGIENAVAPEAANAPLYDLSGRRVVKAVKGGLYIQNGKKFIAR